ncbi:hypothetical protein D3C74_287770 [compost metagenome]
MVFVLVRLIRHRNMQWLVLPKIQGLCMQKKALVVMQLHLMGETNIGASMTNINPFGAARQQLGLVAITRA